MSTPDDYSIDPDTVDVAKKMLDHSIDNNLSDINSTKKVYHQYVDLYNKDFPSNPIVIEDKYL
jgi:hypothetical protein